MAAATARLGTGRSRPMPTPPTGVYVAVMPHIHPITDTPHTHAPFTYKMFYTLLTYILPHHDEFSSHTPCLVGLSCVLPEEFAPGVYPTPHMVIP